MPKIILDRYIMMRILTLFAFFMCILVLALSLERLLRLVDEVTNSGAPFIEAFLLLGYLQPHYIGSALSPALFLAIMITIRRLHEQSELVILYGSGCSLYRIIAPVAVLAIIGSLILFFLVAYIQPLSRYDYRAAYNAIKYNVQQVQLRPHIFQRLNDNLVIRIESVENNNPVTLRGFFSTLKESDGGRTLISADEAVVSSQTAQSFSLLLRSGSIVKEKANGASRVIQFNEYIWSPMLDDPMNYGARGADKRELNLDELIRGGIKDVPLANSNAERLSEIHARLALVASLPLLAFLAVPLALIGGNRSGKAYGIGLGLVILVFYEKIQGFGAALAGAGSISPYLSIWAAWFILLIITLAMFAYRNYYPHSAIILSGRKKL